MLSFLVIENGLYQVEMNGILSEKLQVNSKKDFWVSDKISADSAQSVPELCILQPNYSWNKSKNKNKQIKVLVIAAH